VQTAQAESYAYPVNMLAVYSFGRRYLGSSGLLEEDILALFGSLVQGLGSKTWTKALFRYTKKPKTL